MDLNADILYDRLRKYYPVARFGDSSPKMLLSQPELYIDNIRQFRENHVYLATVEHLPHRPVIENNVVLICIGDSAVLSYYKQHACVLQIRARADFYQVYQTLLTICETFSRWESQTLEMFLGSPGIEAVLESARPIFDGPAFVLDASFQYVASSFSQKELASYESARRTTARGDLDMDAFLTYLREKDISRSMDIHGAFLLDMSEGSYLCVNLFDSSDEYIGCLYIDQTGKEPLEGEKTLAERLGKLVEKVCEENPALINHERDSLRDILRCLMEESPMLRSQRLRLKTVNGQRNYACVSVHYLKPFSSLPVRYICSIFEGLYPGGVFFGFRNTLLGLIPAELLSGRNGKGIGEKLSAILHDMQLRVGVSNEFSDLYMLRTYYLQAEAAMENGQLYGGKEDVYYFSEVALYEMVSNALGGLPVEVYFPKGFRELVNHDGSGGVSYLETLKVFLEENMSFSRASRRLYVHRSTLVERIERIGELLSADLEDPDQRLQLQMILKALEIERLAREKRQ